MKENVEMIEKIKGEHNLILDELANSSERLRWQCEEIDDELDVHDRLLNDIESNTEKNTDLMERVSSKLDLMLEKYSNGSLLCTIFFLLTILILLLLI